MTLLVDGTGNAILVVSDKNKRHTINFMSKKYKSLEFWQEKLARAKINQAKLIAEIARLEFSMDYTDFKSPVGYSRAIGAADIFVCFRRPRIKEHYRPQTFGKLIQLRRKLKMFQTTKLPYYQEMILAYNGV